MILNTIALFLIFFGIYHFSKGLLRLRRQFIFGTLQTSTGVSIIALSALAWAVGTHLFTYQRLSKEQEVASITFERVAPQTFRAKLSRATGPTDIYTIQGDEWQLDARVLKWKPLANLLGLDAVFRLERLSGRYQKLSDEHTKPRSVFSLSESAGLDIWQVKRQWDWLPVLDAEYGNAAYMPMADKATFTIKMTQTGLIARPMDKAAVNRVKNWQQ